MKNWTFASVLKIMNEKFSFLGLDQKGTYVRGKGVCLLKCLRSYPEKVKCIWNNKSLIIDWNVSSFFFLKDMTSRDLVQQRTTKPNGDTVWNNSPLVTAALEGNLAVLDGLHRIHPSTFSVIAR